jgi:DNA-binding NarL/FixJ family response regulator
MKSTTIDILIADDHFVVRQGLRQMLRLYPDLSVIGEAGSGLEVLDMLETLKPALLLLDMTMPGLAGRALIERVRARYATLPILILSMHKDAQVALEALRAGANGYLTKDSEPATLAVAIRKVAEGGRYVDQGLAEQVVFASLTPQSSRLDVLSPREREILRFIAAGISLIDIGTRLHLSAKTVSTHKMRIMQKLEVESNAELIRLAMAEGLAPEFSLH